MFVVVLYVYLAFIPKVVYVHNKQFTKSKGQVDCCRRSCRGKVSAMAVRLLSFTPWSVGEHVGEHVGKHVGLVTSPPTEISSPCLPGFPIHYQPQKERRARLGYPGTLRGR